MLVESESQRLLTQVFPFECPSFLFCLAHYPWPWSHSGYLIFFLFFLFSGAVPIASSQFSMVGGRTPGDQGPPPNGV